MKKNNKELVNFLYREIIGISNLLEGISQGDLEKMEKIHVSLPYLFLRVDDVLEWCNYHFNLINCSEDFEDSEYEKSFTKFHIPLCEDCEQEMEGTNYYMVKDEIWDKFGANIGMLCLPCLEKRMERKLTKEDFTNCPLNDENEYIKELNKILN